MFLRHNRCRGICLFKFGRNQLELWFAPHREVIESHIHPDIDSKIIFIAGRLVGRIGNRLGTLDWRDPHDWFRVFYVPSGTPHSAFVYGPFCIFANWETWKRGVEVTSAAHNFQPAQ